MLSQDSAYTNPARPAACRRTKNPSVALVARDGDALYVRPAESIVDGDTLSVNLPGIDAITDGDRPLYAILHGLEPRTGLIVGIASIAGRRARLKIISKPPYSFDLLKF